MNELYESSYLSVMSGANDKLRKENKDLQNRIKKVIINNQRIIDYGFDYDGFNNVEDLKKLIDMLVDYARKNQEILKGSDDNENNSFKK